MVNTARILFTVFCFVSFILIVLLTYRKGAKSSYDDIARNVVDDDDLSLQKGLGVDLTRENGAK